jgi:hypothetical protein
MPIPIEWQSVADQFRSHGQLYRTWPLHIHHRVEPFDMHVFEHGPEISVESDGASQVMEFAARRAGELLAGVKSPVVDRVPTEVLTEPNPTLRWLFAVPFILRMKPTAKMDGFINFPEIAPTETRDYRLGNAFAMSDAAIHELFSVPIGTVAAMPVAPIYLGDGLIEFPNGEQIRLFGNDANVVEALIEFGPLDLQDLKDKSGVGNANVVAQKIREKHPGLSPFISLPGGKSHGGYRTSIVDGRKPSETISQ